MAEADAPGDNVERMRKMLSSYYGLGSENGAQGGSTTDIDSANFDADAYAASLLRTERLSSLLKRNGQLVKEVKAINSERKMLVHENYNRFICATDTIRQMKHNVEDMEKKMRVLMKDMDSICEGSSVIDAKLAPRRTQIEKLVGVRGLLKKLEFLFELPRRLTRCIELEAFAEAVECYVTASDVLKQHLHVSSFKAILVEAEDIIGKLRDDMKDKLKNNKAMITSQRLAEYVPLLLRLQEPADALQSSFLAWHTAHLKTLLKQCAENSEISVTTGSKIPEDNNGSPVPTDVKTYIDNVNQSFIEEFVEICKQHGLMFPQARDQSSEFAQKHIAFTKSVFGDFFVDVRQEFLEAGPTKTGPLSEDSSGTRSPEASGADGAETVDDLAKSQDSVQEFAETEARIMKTDEEVESDLGAAVAHKYDRLSAALQTLRHSIRPAHLMVPQARLNDRVAEVMEHAIRHQVELAFRQLQRQVEDRLIDAISVPAQKAGSASKMSGDSSDAVAMAPPPTKELVRAILSDIEMALRGLQPLVNVGTSLLKSLSSVFADLVQGQLHHFFVWFNNLMETFCQPDDVDHPETAITVGGHGHDTSADSPTTRSAVSRRTLVLLPQAMRMARRPQNALVLACLCREMVQSGVTNALSVLIECLPVASAPDHETASYGSLVDIPDLIKRTKATTKQLLRLFVRLQSERVCALLRTSIEAPDWLRMKEPREVRMVMELLLGELNTMSRSVAAILGGTFTPNSVPRRPLVRALKPHIPAPSSSGLGSMRATGLRLDIERLFAKKLQIFGEVHMDRESLTAGVLRAALKTFFECVRLSTFSKNGFQQVQVDVHFLRLMMLRYVREMKLLDTLADEVIISARGRCLDPKDIDASVIEAICKRKRDKLGI